jgi:hypothetical protein
MSQPRIHADWNGELSKAFLQTSEWVRQFPEDQKISIQLLLGEVEQVMASRPAPFRAHHLVEWWSGSRTEATWSLLHQVQLELLRTAPLALMQQLFEVVMDHCQSLPANDTARIQFLNFISQRPVSPLREEDILGGRG